MEFSYNINQAGPSTVELQLKGYFDEFATLPDNHDFSKYTKLYVDFAQIEFINSGGVKVWVNFAEYLESHQKLKIYFQDCRRAIVNQINLIDGFLPKNAEVLSLYIPIFCNRCEKSFEVLQEVSKVDKDIGEVVNRITDPKCENFPKCRKDFEVDIFTDQYFRFLKY